MWLVGGFTTKEHEGKNAMWYLRTIQMYYDDSVNCLGQCKKLASSQLIRDYIVLYLHGAPPDNPAV